MSPLQLIESTIHYSYAIHNRNKLPVDAVAVEDCSSPLVVEVVTETAKCAIVHKRIPISMYLHAYTS